jgi:hypothetical protein
LIKNPNKLIIPPRLPASIPRKCGGFLCAILISLHQQEGIIFQWQVAILITEKIDRTSFIGVSVSIIFKIESLFQ